MHSLYCSRTLCKSEHDRLCRLAYVGPELKHRAETQQLKAAQFPENASVPNSSKCVQDSMQSQNRKARSSEEKADRSVRAAEVNGEGIADSFWMWATSGNHKRFSGQTDQSEGVLSRTSSPARPAAAVALGCSLSSVTAPANYISDCKSDQGTTYYISSSTF